MPNLQVVSVSRHAQQRWKRYTNYAFAAGDALCPLVAQELPKVLMSLPIGFIKVGDGFLPAAMMGLQPGKNLLVAPDGRWLTGYIPAAYRGYPFSLAKTAEGQRVLCIDEDSGLLSESEGEPFFDAEGKPVQAISEVLSFLSQVQTNREATERACALLQAHGLIRSWPIKLRGDTGEQELTGLYCIDESALKALPAEALAALRDADALSLAYCQLLSMQHITQLGPLADAHARAAQKGAAQAANAELDLEFLNRSETISFG